MSTTTNLALNEPAYNSTSPTWDQPLNYNSTILDAVMGNTTSIALTNSNVTLTGPTSTGAGQTQAMRIVLTGAISTNITVTFPSGISGSWVIYNTTSGAYTITIASGGGGTTVTAPQGFNIIVYSDGINIRYANDGTVVSPLPVANGGTGLTSLTANNVVLGNGTSAVQFVAPGASGNVLTSNGTTWVSGGGTSPTQTIYTSGSGTYTLPSNVKWLRVRMVGGGGGGGGSNGGASGGSSGGTTTFGSSFLVANGGSGGGTGATGSNGGTASISSGAVGVAFTGTSGIQAGTSTTSLAGGNGGSSPFGGGGMGGGPTGGSGYAAVTNTGSGGGGASNQGNPTGNYVTGAGGGAGGYIDVIIGSPSSSYSYSVGTGGSGGSGGGAAGAAGIIIIEEHYGS